MNRIPVFLLSLLVAMSVSCSKPTNSPEDEDEDGKPDKKVTVELEEIEPIFPISIF